MGANMFFRKKTPEPPPISNEQQYIAWFIGYSEEFAHIRKLDEKTGSGLSMQHFSSDFNLIGLPFDQI